MQTEQNISGDPAFGMTDLEEALQGPDGDRIRHDAVERLGRMSNLLATALTKGAPPHQYDRLQAMQIAVATASRILADKPHPTAFKGEI